MVDLRTIRMVDLRTGLAVVLGAGVGLFAILFPEAVVSVYSVGRGPTGRHGRYGEGGAPETYVWLVRLVGVATVVVALGIGAQAVGFV